MELIPEVCRRARLARDPRFDGKFFIGVKTTGIYCRPVCPARSPHEGNVAYYISAAAASEAGLRPCLRCRPECSPGTPAWIGSSTTVSRALREIAGGSVESGSLEGLAARLGMGVRHLRRLFVSHLGASPVAVAQTQRLLAAKRLMDQTQLPLTTIALAAGFGSVRRFNAAFLHTYGRCPRDMRRSESRDPDCQSYRIPLRYRPPFDWDALIAFLSARALPGVESVTDGVYRRSISLGGQSGWLAVQPVPHESELSLSIQFPDPAKLLRIVAQARRIFDLDADPLTIESHLGRDTLLAPLLRARPGLRIPGAWNGFEIGVRAILGQQVSVAGATTLAGRLVARFGTPLEDAPEGITHFFPSPEKLAASKVASIGLPAKRAEAIEEFARKVSSGELTFDGVLNVEEFQRILVEIPGVGGWTAQYIALRGLGEPDAFPSGDLALLKALGLKTVREIEARAEAWRPWRGYAALQLWQGVKDGKFD